MLDSQVTSEFGDILPTTRDNVLEEWRSDPSAIIDQAREADTPLDAFLTARAGPTQESPGSTSEWLLYNQGIRMVDTFQLPSTPLLACQISRNVQPSLWLTS